MGISHMKDELHGRLWSAQQRWFALKDQGHTKHSLKMQGLRERGNMFFATRGIIFTGATIIVKFGALYGKWESFHALSKKLGERIRELARSGQLRGPARPHASPEVRAAVIERLKHLDALAEGRTGQPRAYGLALELQKEGSLRSIEATDRFTRQCLLVMEGDMGRIAVVGKGGKVRTAVISGDLYKRLGEHFSRSKEEALVPRRAYQVALRRATLAVGGIATGSHAHRRTSARIEELRAFVQQTAKEFGQKCIYFEQAGEAEFVWDPAHRPPE